MEAGTGIEEEDSDSSIKPVSRKGIRQLISSESDEETLAEHQKKERRTMKHETGEILKRIKGRYKLNAMTNQEGAPSTNRNDIDESNRGDPDREGRSSRKCKNNVDG